MRYTTAEGVRRFAMLLLTAFFVLLMFTMARSSIERYGHFDANTWEYLGINFLLMSAGLTGFIKKLGVSIAISAIITIIAALIGLAAFVF